jgi:hypothetical protein
MDEKDKEIKELRLELLNQWSSNHWEHCQGEWPHDGDCSWPVPAIVPDSVVSEFLLQSEGKADSSRQQ